MPVDRPGMATPDHPRTQATAAAPPLTSWRPFLCPERLGEVGSTNLELLSRAESGAPEGTVLIAETQREGRGRLGRRWRDVPGGSLLCSLLFRPPSPDDAGLAPLAVSLSILEACREVGVGPGLKWPNDVVEPASGSKLGGVLSELRPGAVVVGLGLNVNWPPGEELPPGAASVDRILGAPVDRERLTERFLGAVSLRWDALRPGRRRARSEVAAAYAEYRAACTTLGAHVVVSLPSVQITGRAVEVDDGGRLVLETASGRQSVEAGDVVHLRPGPAVAAG